MRSTQLAFSTLTPSQMCLRHGSLVDNSAARAARLTDSKPDIALGPRRAKCRRKYKVELCYHLTDGVFQSLDARNAGGGIRLDLTANHRARTAPAWCRRFPRRVGR